MKVKQHRGPILAPRFCHGFYRKFSGRLSCLCDSLRAALCGLRVPAYRARRHPGFAAAASLIVALFPPERPDLPGVVFSTGMECGDAKLTLFILQQDENWLIRFRDGDFGPYRTRQEAMMFAVDAAQQLGEEGENAEVCDGRNWASAGMDLWAGRCRGCSPETSTCATWRKKSRATALLNEHANASGVALMLVFA